MTLPAAPQRARSRAVAVRRGRRHADPGNGRAIGIVTGDTRTNRGVVRLTEFQSSTVGRRRPAVNATAGMCSSRFVLPPNAANTASAFLNAASVRMSGVRMPRLDISKSARAERRALSSQIG